jgi:hypothetical protein
MAPSESETRLSVGDSVVDSEDDDPDETIVIERPSGQAISEWAHDTESGTATVAATNPDYPADDQLIVVVFRSALNESVPDWQAADPDHCQQTRRMQVSQSTGFRNGDSNRSNRAR